jgi:hypothetical protein
MLVDRALKNSQLTAGESRVIYGTDTKIKACVIGAPSKFLGLNWRVNQQMKFCLLPAFDATGRDYGEL